LASCEQLLNDLFTNRQEIDKEDDFCDISLMRAAATIWVSGREKKLWQRVAKSAGENLREFACKAIQQRVRKLQTNERAWGGLLGAVSVDRGSATNQNIRRLFRPSDIAHKPTPRKRSGNN
jgi:hypothetical protein